MDNKLLNGMLDFMDKSPVNFFAVKTMEEILIKNNFEELDLSKDFNLKENSKFYIKNNDSAIIAFSIGKIKRGIFKIIDSHTDSPGFKVKSNPLIKTENMLSLNTEVYGGPILNTWLDRPLSMAGRVILKSDDPLNPKMQLINFEKNLCIIPNLAIHMNRDINKGFELNPQIHTLPLVALDNSKKYEKKDFIKEVISKKLEIKTEEILDYELYLYDRQKASILGLNDEFISSGRIDNLASAYLSLKSLVENKNHTEINVIIATDNEEVGSGTKMGADSSFIETSLERIVSGLKMNREDYLKNLENSFMISSDMAHGIHPNFKEKTDPTNIPLLGGGPVIKYAANKSYASDSISGAIFKDLCARAKVPVQTFYNRSDLRGGTTIGPITSRRINVRTVDVGCPMLAMHSVRELMAIKDLEYMFKVFKEFFSL